MTEQTPKLDAQTLEYVISMLNDDIKDYNRFVDKTDDSVKRKTYKAIINQITFFRNELKTIIEEQEEE